ncbi:MAG TPA: hypothetical protein VGN16_20855 [Acidobacteriaceae bacterium]
MFMLLLFVAQAGWRCIPAQVNTEVGEIRLKPDQVAKGTQFVGLHIVLSGGEFEGLQAFPEGWRIVIDREAPWKGRLDMTANDGARPLSLEEVWRLGIRVRRAKTGQDNFSVSGHLILLTGKSATKDIPFGAMSFGYESVFIRRRLR